MNSKPTEPHTRKSPPRAKVVAMGDGPDMTIISDAEPSLAELQKLVDGYIECVRLPNGDDLICNEEGLNRSMAINFMASALAGRPIVGPCVLLRGKARLR